MWEIISQNPGLCVRLCVLMFLEYAIWGAWMPVLALRLLGPLKMTGKQTGWIYATLPLACIFAPLASGYLADKWFHTESILLVCHALGAVLLFLAAKQTQFRGMLVAMFLYAVFYTATLPLVNQMLFQQFPEAATFVFFWAPVAWALVGAFLTVFRQWRKLGGDGADSLYLAAILSVFMVVVAFFQQPLEPSAKGNPLFESLAMLKNTNYLIFILAQMVVSGTMQFYFLGTGQFLQDRGLGGKYVSAVMALAQAVQAAATICLLGPLADNIGFRWIFVIGAICWSILYLTYVLSRGMTSVILIQAFHGLAYVFFMIGGQTFVGITAPEAIGASAQSLIFIVTNGIGLFFGTQLAGYVMERNAIAGKFSWPKIWAVPLAISLAGAIVFAVLFKAPERTDFLPQEQPETAVTTTVH